MNKAQEAARAFRVSNIEFVYRATWQQVLWEGYYLEPDGASVFLRPCSEKYGEWWPVWDVRRQNLIAEQLSLMSGRVFGHFKEVDVPDEIRSLVPSMRVERANWRRGSWHFRFSKMRPIDREYRSIVAASIGIRDTSLWPYLFEVVPKFTRSGITLSDVLKAWQVMESCAEAMAFSVRRKNKSEIEDIREFSLKMPISQLSEVLQRCCGYGEQKALDVISFLSLDVSDVNFLFNRGVWANPIVPNADGELVRIVLPVLTIGNIVRAFENWIEQCDFSRAGELKGENFEREVVLQVRSSASESELPVIVEIFGPNLKVLGEEIDALLAVGNSLYVLECKSFLTPGDSVERHNVLKRIAKGARQAERKASVLSKNLKKLGDHIERDLAENCLIRAAVVVASPYGVGLNLGSIPVIDLDYLVILAGSMSIMSAMVQKGDNQVQEITHFYAPYGFSQEKFDVLLREPFVQSKYFEALEWSYQPFPSGNSKLSLMLPFPLVTRKWDIARAGELVAQLAN